MRPSKAEAALVPVANARQVADEFAAQVPSILREEARTKGNAETAATAMNLMSVALRWVLDVGGPEVAPALLRRSQASARGGDYFSSLPAREGNLSSEILAFGDPRRPQSVSVSGQATVDQTLHVDISLDPSLRATIDALSGVNFSVPLGSATTGQMDTDAAPRAA